MQILDGKSLASLIKKELRKEVEDLKNRGTNPKLVTISIGDSRKFEIYLRNKNIACGEVGICYENISLPEKVTQENLIRSNTKFKQV